MVDAVNTATAAVTQKSGLANAKATDASEMQDRFLKLLVAQLNNQDPMNPLDNAQVTSQMAQINTVTGIQKMQQSIEQLTAQMSASQTLQGMQLIGREVAIDGNELWSDGEGRMKGGFELPKAADQVNLEILSAGGQVIGTLPIGPQKAGAGTFSITASDYPLASKFQIKAIAGGQAVTAATQGVQRVQSVNAQAAGGVQIRLDSGNEVALSSIKSIY